ncbi:hypothetical protein HX109_03765 [Galbibacter sp. BG1]|uniref:NTP/NDP exchange transporter n=1 Tax=Galbibacter sp. BG1 TaxID=1170699 RepID=UPI0015BE6142|nr:Npt1/Npt2 family nucleotide transporter [Galbibacter sp. BG1]QLE00720.1 hypothetical protein HX109_03765 [Galbibacter sp. BG1]
MIKSLLKKIFDLRDGEINIALLMQGYIFFIIATLLIIKPSINSLFLSDLGAQNLPYAYLLVALTAVLSSYFYSRATERYSLVHIIRITLTVSVISLVVLGFLLHLNLVKGWILYLFYTGVAIYALLATSQFWILANLVFNVREAKRLFGFIGAGAIVGGIFGGYLTTILAPVIGNANLIFIAALFLLCCLPILGYIWKTKIKELNTFKVKKRAPILKENPFKLVLGSKHLTFLAAIIGVGVLTAKLVEYQFSYVAAKEFTDSDELTAFFGFWLSTFNVASLLFQLFITRRIVGIWGVGYALLLLPAILFFGGILFLAFPELWVVIFLKATDASLKQSVYKSSVELIALPLPLELKKKTKSFIDVVVDSVATGIAGCLLIFFIRGLEVPPKNIMFLIIVLALVWIYFIYRLRKEYFSSFKKNLESIATVHKKNKREVSKETFLQGMRRVFNEGSESDILYMLNKAMELKDKRLEGEFVYLLSHPSNKIKAAALHNLFYLNSGVIYLEVNQLLKIKDREVVIAALDYLLLHAERNESIVFESYLDHPDNFISNAALLCLAKESRDNQSLKEKFSLGKRIQQKITHLETTISEKEDFIELLQIIGYGDFKDGYPIILHTLTSEDTVLEEEAIKAAGLTMNEVFIDPLLEKLLHKEQRHFATEALVFYGNGMISLLHKKITATETPVAIKQFLPNVIGAFKSQLAVNTLIKCFKEAEDLSVRLQVVAALTKLKEENPHLQFDNATVAKLILEECKLYDKTINAMHSQIIVYYVRRKKLKIDTEEMNAREGLMELLERRLENGLKRIFKLLELRYSPNEIRMAYNGILSGEPENITNAIEFLDLLLNPNLKSVLIPIVEATILDTSSEEVIDAISKNRMTEFECFKNILEGKDVKLKIAVVYLISKIKDPKYFPLLETAETSKDFRLKEFAHSAMEEFS